MSDQGGTSETKSSDDVTSPTLCSEKEVEALEGKSASSMTSRRKTPHSPPLVPHREKRFSKGEATVSDQNEDSR